MGVSKTTSSLLVEYICLGGEGLRSRVEEDAKRRARRYKEWEKVQQQKPQEEQGDEKDKAEQEDAPEEKKKQSSEDASWNGLDDHDKRKEYKRARKLLDSLKAAKEKGEK